MKDDKNYKNSAENDKDKNSEGYPLYPPSDDIYSQLDEVSDLDPEDLTRVKPPNEDPDAPNEKRFSDDVTGGDLDIPGSELDDDQEEIGSEDEENNGYSMGQD